MRTEAPVTLTVYSRAYCHLCEDMVAALEALPQRGNFAIAVVDVDSNPALEARYGERVPVLTHGTRELCHYHLDAAAVTAYLAEIG